MRSRSLVSPALLLLLGSPASAPSFGAQAEDPTKEKPIVPGERIIERFELEDIDGKSHDLLPWESERVTVIVFWSLRDPVSRGYVDDLQLLEADFAKEGLRVFLVNPNYDELVAGTGDPLERMRKYKKDEKVTLPILVDPGAKLADRFGALASAHAFLIGPDRKLRYAGGVDDDPRGTRRKKGAEVREWLRIAIEDVYAGREIEETYLRPSGRPIKRAPKSE